MDLQREAFARSVVRGLDDNPRWLSCRYLYDQQGSEIFERITETPEYYPTRTENDILEHEAARIRELCGATTLVELGAGSATKTRHLLKAWTAVPASGATAQPSSGGEAQLSSKSVGQPSLLGTEQPLTRPALYVPIDISRSMLAETCSALRREFPSLALEPLAGSYEQALPELRRLSPLTLAFLGSSVGNFNEEELDEFFSLLTANLSPGDQLLLGIDLVKDKATLEAAYNDAAGWSSAFTLNLFARMNRELGTSIDTGDLEHVAVWNAEKSRIDISARCRRPLTISLPEWEREYRFQAGESILVEISRKFRIEAMLAEAGHHGFDAVESFSDPDRYFGLLLLRYRGGRDAATLRRDKLARKLGEQRARTLAIARPLSAIEMSRQHSPILSPVTWDLGHVASYEREWVTRARLEAGREAAPPSDAGIYDPIRHPRSVRGDLPLASPEDCRATLDETSFQDDDAPLLRKGYVFSMLAQHEAQHSETILQSIQLLPALHYDSTRSRPAAAPGNCVASGEVFVAGGPFTMGSDDEAEAYDNERPAHLVELDSFWIDVSPVTNGDYLRFVEDGGYRRRELWSSEGWRWLQESRIEHPGAWQRASDGSWKERCFGRIEALELDRPVVHVCWYEAAACAGWLGKRLPSEAEWEKAAAWDLERGLPRLYPWGDSAPTPKHANLDQRNFAPLPVGSFPRGRSYYGCSQMLGDVWEWTSSDFLPYPGFRAWPYPEYSELHFGSRHKVLRGGSWATPSIAMRNSFRNWDLPQRRQLFAGFRCARD